MSGKETTGVIPEGKMVSFKIEKEVVDAARKQAFARMIPLSMWFREAAREKLASLKRERARAKHAA